MQYTHTQKRQETFKLSQDPLQHRRKFLSFPTWLSRIRNSRLWSAVFASLTHARTHIPECLLMDVHLQCDQAIPLGVNTCGIFKAGNHPQRKCEQWSRIKRYIYCIYKKNCLPLYSNCKLLTIKMTIFYLSGCYLFKMRITNRVNVFLILFKDSLSSNYKVASPRKRKIGKTSPNILIY